MKYIDADKLLAEIERWIDKAKENYNESTYSMGRCDALAEFRNHIVSLQQEPRFPQYDNIVEKVFGAGNIEGFEYREAEMLVALAKEELLKSIQQEQPDENKLPDKRTRVNYAICKLQSFKPLREAIVLDDYVYDEGKCYRENLLNYIHAIPGSRLVEIRSYLKEKGWWPYNDDADWEEEREQPEVDLEEFDKGVAKLWGRCAADPNDSIACLHIETFSEVARHFYKLGLNARNKD